MCVSQQSKVPSTVWTSGGVSGAEGRPVVSLVSCHFAVATSVTTSDRSDPVYPRQQSSVSLEILMRRTSFERPQPRLLDVLSPAAGNGPKVSEVCLRAPVHQPFPRPSPIFTGSDRCEFQMVSSKKKDHTQETLGNTCERRPVIKFGMFFFTSLLR